MSKLRSFSTHVSRLVNISSLPVFNIVQGWRGEFMVLVFTRCNDSAQTFLARLWAFIRKQFIVNIVQEHESKQFFFGSKRIFFNFLCICRITTNKARQYIICTTCHLHTETWWMLERICNDFAGFVLLFFEMWNEVWTEKWKVLWWVNFIKQFL